MPSYGEGYLMSRMSNYLIGEIREATRKRNSLAVDNDDVADLIKFLAGHHQSRIRNICREDCFKNKPVTLSAKILKLISQGLATHSIVTWHTG
jgi:hypothetical protein